MPTGTPPRSARVLFITADQQRQDSLPTYGRDFVRAPNLERLARGGAVFDRAFVPAPLCQPTRAAILTGLSPHVHGVLDNHVWFSPPVHSWVPEVTAAGYRTAAIGKMHFYPWDDPHGFTDRISAEDKRHYYRRDDYTLWLESQGYERKHPPSVPGYYEGMGAMPSDLPTDLHLDSFIGDRGAEWLRANASEPFFAWVSFNSPHDPYDPPAELAHLYDDAPIPSPVGSEADLATRPAAQREAYRGTLENPLFDMDYRGLSPAAIRRIRAHYYAEITHIDNQVGKLLAALDEAGVLDDTLIIYSSDHGDALGDHGLIFKNFFYESMVRVPLLVHGPGVAAGSRTSALVDTIDIAATILTHLGLPLPDPCQSRALQPLLAHPQQTHREAVYSYVNDRAMVRTDRWKLTRYGDGDGELYDLETDPNELHNLHHDPTHAAERAAMIERLASRAIADQAVRSRLNRCPPDPDRARAFEEIRAAKGSGE
ncbi:MAG: sulfatase-like hydrolase/transferase [Chloroflexi bacterium]|nr:sulfatase-like hydrolase/transferase [Chloroflexota bacterium]